MQIDFVIPWVDGSDPEWLNQYCMFDDSHTADNSRYRDWGLLRYWFRSVETYAPWVNHIYFITWGHIPDWLNTDHPKLRVIHHKDYIPKEYLPTFNSNTIELNLHRIPELSEHFVYFNDDTFLNTHTLPEDFFKNGLPCNCAVMEPFLPVDPYDPYPHILLNDIALLNKHFIKYNVLKKHFLKWYNPIYGKYMLKNIYYTPGKFFSGLRNLHIPSSMCKSTFRKVWVLEPELMSTTCTSRFRSRNDLNQNIMSFFDICTGNFAPRSAIFGACYGIERDDDLIIKDLRSGKHKLICINDHPYVTDFNKEKNILLNVFDEKLPIKSAFER